MVILENTAVELTALVDSHFEWLLVRDSGKTFPIRKTEIEIEHADGKLLLGFFDDKGFRSCRVGGFVSDAEGIALDLTADFGLENERIRLIPRTPASELALNIELARLVRANEIAAMIVESLAPLKLIRVALNKDNGRLAQITIEDVSGTQTAVMSDVSGVSTPEMLLASAILLLKKLEMRVKKPIDNIWIAAEKKHARNLQKLHALLNGPAKSRIAILEIADRNTHSKVNRLAHKKIADLWREKPKKLVLPAEIEISDTARDIIKLSPEKIDVIFSKQGETLRFLGLPFARVRRMLGVEKAWFGIDRDRRMLAEGSRADLFQLIENLATHRRADPLSKRHDLYRLSPESWLESILRRNIKLLDANLILSPLYNQFRTSADKIDLLALRKDGRLVIIELKTSPDREMVFQAADYWRKIELQRRRGELKKARAFGDLEILDKPALVYTVAPALSFDYNYEYFAKMLSKEIEIWRFELHEHWRSQIKVIARVNYQT